jgi:structural maintenance of chromosome 2
MVRLTVAQHLLGKPGSEFDFKARDPQKVRERLAKINDENNKLSRQINRKVMGMFEKYVHPHALLSLSLSRFLLRLLTGPLRAEAEYANLMEKKRIIENDKAKLLAVIEELDQKKKEALEKTWEKVNKYAFCSTILLCSIFAFFFLPEALIGT